MSYFSVSPKPASRLKVHYLGRSRILTILRVIYSSELFAQERGPISLDKRKCAFTVEKPELNKSYCKD